MKINKIRLEKVNSMDLSSGSHKSIKEGGCILEMVSYLANEPWSDHPKCACPILTKYAIAMNDRFNDKDRQLLKPLIPLLLDTKSTDEIQIARKRLIMWRNVTITYPLILEFRKLLKIAKELRKFRNILEDMAAAYKYLQDNKQEIYAYAYAYADADAYAYAYAYADADANAYAYAYADADAYAYANAYAYAYADAYAYAYADAYALREKIVAAAIETLRLAIDVKELK